MHIFENCKDNVSNLLAGMFYFIASLLIYSNDLFTLWIMYSPQWFKLLTCLHLSIWPL